MIIKTTLFQHTNAAFIKSCELLGLVLNKPPKKCMSYTKAGAFQSLYLRSSPLQLWLCLDSIVGPKAIFRKLSERRGTL